MTDSVKKIIGTSLTAFVSLATLAIVGDWFVDPVAIWLTRSVHAIAVLSSIFGWGVIVNKVQVTK